MAVQFQDYYKILGVTRSATTEEIQKAYRKLARQYHPDINKEKGAEDKFKKVSEAYEVLKNPDSRKKYDALGSNWKTGDNFKAPPGWQNINFDFNNLGGQGGGFSSFFESIFGGSPRRSSVWEDIETPRQPEKKPEAEVILSLSPWEAALGTSVNLSTLSGNVKLKIPAGSQSGTRMRLKGKGSMTRQGPGDLYVLLQIKVPKTLTTKEKELFESLARESKFNPRSR
jgi:curved DNA-binding protein